MADQVGVDGSVTEGENPSPMLEDPPPGAAALAEAYAQTDYRVLTTPPFVLRVAEPSPALCQLHADRGVVSSAFLSAANPGSRLLLETENEQRARVLVRTLEARGLDFVPAIGGAEDQDWPPEPSVLILGITLDEARALAAEAGQRAFLWIGSDGLPSLVWLEPSV
jgi:hypothetical protein